MLAVRLIVSTQSSAAYNRFTLILRIRVLNKKMKRNRKIMEKKQTRIAVVVDDDDNNEL